MSFLPYATDDTNLGMLLPLRAGLGMAEYQAFLLGEFPESVVDDVADRLCPCPGGDAVLFSADPEDDGNRFTFHGCDGDNLTFSAKAGMGDRNYRKALVFVEVGQNIYTFFADLRQVFEGRLHFVMPRLVHKRSARYAKRVRLDGKILLRRKDGRAIQAVLQDFSPTGASFLTGNEGFRVGETMLAEFEIPDCGICETVVTSVRTETRSGGGFRTLVAVKMALTREQRKKAEQLYLCKKAEQMRKVVDSSRSTPIPGD